MKKKKLASSAGYATFSFSLFFTSFITGRESIADKPLFLNFFHLDLKTGGEHFHQPHRRRGVIEHVAVGLR